jgi:hypothetical protein
MGAFKGFFSIHAERLGAKRVENAKSVTKELVVIDTLG